MVSFWSGCWCWFCGVFRSLRCTDYPPFSSDASDSKVRLGLGVLEPRGSSSAFPRRGECLTGIFLPASSVTSQVLAPSPTVTPRHETGRRSDRWRPTYSDQRLVPRLATCRSRGHRSDRPLNPLYPLPSLRSE